MNTKWLSSLAVATLLPVPMLSFAALQALIPQDHIVTPT